MNREDVLQLTKLSEPVFMGELLFTQTTVVLVNSDNNRRTDITITDTLEDMCVWIVADRKLLRAIRVLKSDTVECTDDMGAVVQRYLLPKGTYRRLNNARRNNTGGA